MYRYFCFHYNSQNRNILLSVNYLAKSGIKIILHIILNTKNNQHKIMENKQLDTTKTLLFN